MSKDQRVDFSVDKVLLAAGEGTRTIGFFNEELGVERISIGDLALKTGEVIVADPLVAPIENAPLDFKLPPGMYNAEAIIGIRADGDRRLGLSMLSTSIHKPVLWQLASQIVPNGTGMTTKVADGVSVDSGLACYFDRVHLDLMNALAEQESGREHIQQSLAEMGAVQTYEFCKLALSDDDEAGAIVFSTGDGDGQYQSYFGMNSGGAVCALVTDFLIFRTKTN